MCRSDGPLLTRDDVVTHLSAPHFPSMALASFRSRRLLLAVVFFWFFLGGVEGGGGGVRLERRPGKPKLSSSCVASSPHLVHVYSSARAHLTHAALTSIAISNRTLSASFIPKCLNGTLTPELACVTLTFPLIWYSVSHDVTIFRDEKKTKVNASTTANYMHIYNGSRFGAIGRGGGVGRQIFHDNSNWSVGLLKYASVYIS